MREAANPCTRCGACCCTFEVVFPRVELDSEGGPVSAALTERVDDKRVRMRSRRRASDPRSRCVALLGTVGVDVRCAIYERRPSPCRRFAAQAAEGRGDVPCGEARRLNGLAALIGSYDAAIVA